MRDYDDWSNWYLSETWPRRPSMIKTICTTADTTWNKDWTWHGWKGPLFPLAHYSGPCRHFPHPVSFWNGEDNNDSLIIQSYRTNNELKDTNLKLLEKCLYGAEVIALRFSRLFALSKSSTLAEHIGYIVSFSMPILSCCGFSTTYKKLHGF